MYQKLARIEPTCGKNGPNWIPLAIKTTRTTLDYPKNYNLRFTKNFFFTLLLHFLTLVPAEYCTFYLCISESIQFYDFELQGSCKKVEKF